jgi:hypothetical protein
MSGKRNIKHRRRSPRPPNFEVVTSDQLPPPERCDNWACVSYRQLREHLRAGRTCIFTVEPSRMVSFWKYLQSRIGVPIAVRLHVRKQRVCVYALPPRRARLGEHPPSRPVLRTAYRGLLRDDAAIRVLVADCGEWLQDNANGWSWHEALARFIAERGDAYPFDFDVTTLAGWIEQTEAAELLNPYVETRNVKTNTGGGKS